MALFVACLEWLTFRVRLCVQIQGGQDTQIDSGLGYLGLCNALNLSSTSSSLVAVFQEGMNKRDLQVRSLRPLPTSAGGGQIAPR